MWKFDVQVQDYESRFKLMFCGLLIKYMNLMGKNLDKLSSGNFIEGSIFFIKMMVSTVFKYIVMLFKSMCVKFGHSEKATKI